MPHAAHPLPVLLFFHGGAWALGNLDTEEATCLSLAEQIPCAVVSVDYRLAPEHPYPAALQDCYAVLNWVAQAADTFGGDARRIAVSGESAGGNLAAALTIKTKDLEGPSIASQVLFYPATKLTGDPTDSQKAFGRGFFLDDADMDGARLMYVPDRELWSHRYVSPLLADDLTGLPPALIITAGCDPLRDEGEAYAKRLKDAGVQARVVCYEDMLHAFLLLFRASRSRNDALATASAALREAFGS
jgi:acetyl esterase